VERLELGAARALFAQLPPVRGEVPPVAYAIEAYERTANPDERQRILGAMTAFLLDGEGEEVETGALFFRNGAASNEELAEHIPLFWQEFVRRQARWNSPLGQVVAGLPLAAGPLQQELRRRYLEAPEALPNLFIKLGGLDPQDTDLWSALLRLLGQCEDLETLATAITLTYGMRIEDVAQTLATRDPALVAQLVPTYGHSSLAAAIAAARMHRTAG
jgi:hypothetical protein